MDLLPTEVIGEVLKWLPANTLLFTCRRVNTHFNKIALVELRRRGKIHSPVLWLRSTSMMKKPLAESWDIYLKRIENLQVPYALPLNTNNVLAGLDNCKFIHTLSVTIFTTKAPELAKLQKSLRSLTLRSTRRLSLNDISSHTQLETLVAYAVPINNVVALAFLVQLTHLNLARTAVFDVSPLKTCVALVEVQLHDTLITDLSVAAHWPQLMRLDVSRTQIRSLAVLAHCPYLSVLTSRMLQLENLSFLPHLQRLIKLDLGGTYSAEESYGAIASCTSLESLDIAWCNVTHLQFCSPLINLRSLSAPWTRVQDITPLTSCVNLGFVELTRTLVSDLRPLRQLKHLNRIVVLGSPTHRQSELLNLN